MTKLNAPESAMFLTKLAMDECRGKATLPMQLATIRLQSVVNALEGDLDMEAFERKILGLPANAGNAGG